MDFGKGLRDAIQQSAEPDPEIRIDRPEHAGYSQTDARRLAKEHGGIALTARPSTDGNNWILGGWTRPDDVWIVVTLDRKSVLFD